MNKLYDIFHIEYGQREYHSKGFLDDFLGKVPLISSGGQNNGIYGYFDILPKYKNVISVPNTGTIGHAFYQGKECCIDDNCLVMIPKNKLSFQEFFYYVLIVRCNKYRFMYGRQITPQKLGEIIIPNKIPDFVYTSKIPDYSDIKDSLNNEKLSLNDRRFEYFNVKDLFEITTDPFIAISEAEESPGKYPFISTGNKNNGASCFTGIDDGRIYPAGCITIASSGNAGETFFQNREFKVTNMITILNPKFDINKYIGLFLVTIIRKEKYRYSYGRKFGIERARQTKIKLPINVSGSPDWEFMESYIKSLPYSKYL